MVIKKPNKIVKLSTLRNKADKMLQELGRSLYSSCEICGGQYSCLHHFWPKSTATTLRYNLKNCIAICQGCHFRHHNGDPTIHATVIEKRGWDWYNDLFKQKHALTKVSKAYYEGVINSLKIIE